MISVEVPGDTRVGVAKQGGAAFTLDLPTTHEVDEWAARHPSPLSRATAIAALIWRGMAT